MDKWFGLQIACAAPGNATQVVEDLTAHPLFDMTNPNRFRAVFGQFAQNQAGFHHSDGRGYALMAESLVKLDSVNPQTAARLFSAFDSWRRFDDKRQNLMQRAMNTVAQTPKLSKDLLEMVTRILAD